MIWSRRDVPRRSSRPVGARTPLPWGRLQRMAVVATLVAAGMAALIKTVLAIRHGAVPPHLHLHSGNPRIPWDRLPVRGPGELTPWPDRGRPRTAGISSFGFSGTNAHVILEQAPEIPEPGNEWLRPLHVAPIPV